MLSALACEKELHFKKKKKKKKPICKAKRSQTFPVLYTHTGREEHGAMSF